MSESIKTREETMALARELYSNDHRYLSESFWKNEGLGDTRVNLYVGVITTALAGAAGAVQLMGINSMPAKAQVFVFVCCALLPLGWVTLRRMIKRNIRTDEYKNNFDHLRQSIKDHSYGFGGLLNYHPFGPKTSWVEPTWNRCQHY